MQENGLWNQSFKFLGQKFGCPCYYRTVCLGECVRLSSYRFVLGVVKLGCGLTKQTLSFAEIRCWPCFFSSVWSKITPSIIIYSLSLPWQARRPVADAVHTLRATSSDVNFFKSRTVGRSRSTAIRWHSTVAGAFLVPADSRLYFTLSLGICLEHQKLFGPAEWKTENTSLRVFSRLLET